MSSSDITTSAPGLLASFQRAVLPPQQLRPSQWAEQYRRLPAHVTAEPGPWRNERTPYLVGIMDAIADEGVEGIVVVKGAQIGFSEAVRNLLGYWIDHDPGPCLVVMPDQKSAEELIEERVRPLMEHTPAVARHVTGRPWDLKKSSLKLDSMSVYLAWSGSSQGMKSRPIRYLLLEEPDEYPTMTGTAGDPISKALKRITTYSAKGRARVILGGTPTIRRNNVWQYWERCGQRRHYWVACPHCGGWQRLVWGGADGPGVKWPRPADGEDRVRHAARVEADHLAWYQCEHCDNAIRDEHKARMLARGLWATEDQVVIGGEVKGPAAKATRWVGFQLSALYSPWVSFSQLAAEWLQAQDNRMALEDFLNQRLAEPFEEIATAHDEPTIRKHSEGALPPATVPAWATAIFTTVDVQRDWFAVCIRAWGWGLRSHLLWYGQCQTFEEVLRMGLQAQFVIDGTQTKASPSHLLIDTGGERTNEVYEFCLRDTGRIIPIKGASARMLKPWRLSTLANGVGLRLIDTGYYKDMLARLIGDPDAAKWQISRDISDAYCLEMTSEVKVVERKTGAYVWKKLISSRRNEAWDCEVYQCAAADMAGVAQQAPQQQPEAPSQHRREDVETRNPLDYRRW